MHKAILRKQIGDLRNALSPQEVKNLSRLCMKNLIALPIYQEASTICVYMPIRNEVETKELIETAIKQGKRVAAPKVIGDEMEFYYITEAFSEGAYGILEPVSKEVLEDETAFIIMPGLAFDENKNRIGYGGGYYDRYLAKHKKHVTAALAYDFQIVEHIDGEEFDIVPNVIVTDKRVIG